jgi:hypothetical protein
MVVLGMVMLGMVVLGLVVLGMVRVPFNNLDIVEGIYAKENRFISFNVIILPLCAMSRYKAYKNNFQSYSWIFKSFFGIDHQYIDLTIDDD